MEMTSLFPDNFAPMIIGLGLIVLVGAIIIAAIQKYDADSVLKILGAIGTLIGFIVGGMGTYFFTREQVQRQASQINRIETAFQASQHERAAAAQEVFRAALQLKPHVDTPENQKAVENLEHVATQLRTMSYGPGSNSTKSDKLFEAFERNTASPSPSVSP